jgi:hypothetical protein
MMMAPDSTSDRPELSPEAVSALRVALQQYLETGRESDVRPALQLVAKEARTKRVHAERLLVVLKDVWTSLPQLGDKPEAERQNQLLQRVITLCIREYYSA